MTRRELLRSRGKLVLRRWLYGVLLVERAKHRLVELVPLCPLIAADGVLLLRLADLPLRDVPATKGITEIRYVLPKRTGTLKQMQEPLLSYPTASLSRTRSSL